MVVRLLENVFCESKTWKTLKLVPPKAKLSPDSYCHPSGRGKLLIPSPEAAFFWKSVSLLNKKQEEEKILKVL